MGVQGAALATVLSQLAASVWTFKFLTGKNTIIKIKLSAMRCQAKRVKKILVLGLSGFTMSVTNSAVQIACNVSLQNYGSDVPCLSYDYNQFYKRSFANACNGFGKRCTADNRL